MTDVAAARPAKRGKGRRPTANRFRSLAGGDPAIESAIDETQPSGSSGLIPVVSTLAANEGLHIVQVSVAEIAPHPFNDPERSEAQPGDPKWDELVNGVRANGVRLPVLLVTRDAFVNTRPALAGQIPETARYVLVYGHRRRRAALEVERETIPAHVDDSIMIDNGDLYELATENLGRKDLSEFAEAELYARFSDHGLSTRDIAERLGASQSTVTRRLGLMLIAPEIREAVEVGVLKSTPDGEGERIKLPVYEAAALGNTLPYGQHRRWQKSKDPDQNTEQRRQEQLRATQLILERKSTLSFAVDYVKAERAARDRAAELNIEIVEDPSAELGQNYYEHRIAEYNPDLDVFGAIDPGMGSLTLYSRSKKTPETEGEQKKPGTKTDESADLPEETAPKGKKTKDKKEPPATPTSISGEGLDDGGEDNGLDHVTAEEAAALAEQENPELLAAKAAQAHRRQACAALITHQVSNTDLLNVLAGQYISGVAARAGTSAVRALLRDWDAHVEGLGPKARYTKAWHRAVAAAELHLSELKDKAWDEDAVTHLKLLMERVAYQPTPWERTQLEAATR